MAVRKFERGSSTYPCRVCKRLTRNTGDEGSARLCRECFDLAGIDNEISDNGPLGPDSFTSPETVVELLVDLVRHGVDIRSAWGNGHIAEFIPTADARVVARRNDPGIRAANRAFARSMKVED